MKVAYADCFSGISGDMFLAALLDAGLSLDILYEGIASLHLPEKVELKISETHKGMLRASCLEVVVPESNNHRHLTDILEILSASDLSRSVKEKAEKIFTLVASAEARVHGIPVEQVHFHEIGALDSIVDITGAAIGLDALGVDQLYASPLPYGSGFVEISHGKFPLPAPAVLEICRMSQIPLTPSDSQKELVTPTGAAILGSMANFERPDLVISDIGIGAGKRDLPWPNVMRLLVGEPREMPSAEMVQIETNIDDMNPQFYPNIMEKLFAAGARDVYLTPIQMKKNRPGTLMGIIALKKDETVLADLILRETTTLGMRVIPVRRYEAKREFRTVQTIFGELSIKEKILDGKVIQSVPEYEDCLRLANEKDVSLAEIYQAVQNALVKGE